MTGTEVSSIPFTAWQQAAIIGLFIVFAVYVFSWLAQREEKHEARTQAFQKSESDKWQKHMTEENDKWRKFSQDQREQNNCAMADVNAGLGNLTKVTEGLVMEVREMRTESREISTALALHDDQAKEILHHVQTNGKVAAKPRARVNN